MVLPDQRVRVGDVVRLISGGPEMRVHMIARGAARCIWHEFGDAQFGYFLLELLVPVLNPSGRWPSPDSVARGRLEAGGSCDG
jgi:uncharacterized protein YodC (DUF2158 family)